MCIYSYVLVNIFESTNKKYPVHFVKSIPLCTFYKKKILILYFYIIRRRILNFPLLLVTRKSRKILKSSRMKKPSYVASVRFLGAMKFMLGAQTRCDAISETVTRACCWPNPAPLLRERRQDPFQAFKSTDKADEYFLRLPASFIMLTKSHCRTASSCIVVPSPFFLRLLNLASTSRTSTFMVSLALCRTERLSKARDYSRRQDRR